MCPHWTVAEHVAFSTSAALPQQLFMSSARSLQVCEVFVQEWPTFPAVALQVTPVRATEAPASASPLP